jgi:putative transposase
MPRMARVVVPHIPHHITQRGNRRQKVFFGDGDYRQYIQLLSQYCSKVNVKIWAYCLMPNHVHLVMVPKTENGLHQALAEAHRRYTCFVNSREDWRGYLWQGRFASFPMDEKYLYSAVRYIELNPVRAGLCAVAEDWEWSSARAHLNEIDDDLVTVKPMLHRVKDWSGYLSAGIGIEESQYNDLRKHTGTGRPLGSDSFLSRLELLTGRRLKCKRAGRKFKNEETAKQ